MSHPLVGRRVLNINRQSCDLTPAQRLAYHGTVVEVLEGCNPIIKVQFDGSKFPSWLPPQDLAHCELWPHDGNRVQVA